MIKFSLLILFLFVTGCGSLENRPPLKVIDIPTACKDRNNIYLPITTILSKISYNDTPQLYQPIKNAKGFIAQDFNQDNNADYHFLERSGQEIRLISCLSDQSSYKRRITPFKVHEMKDPDFQTISEFIQLEGKALILSINKHEHNWGSDSETSHYAYNKKSGDFVLTQREIVSSSGDGTRSDTYEFYDLQKKRYKRSNTCGSLEEGCKSQKKSGRIVLPKIQATLLKPDKLYIRLMPD